MNRRAMPSDLRPDASVFTRLRVGIEALAVLKDDMANPVYARRLHLAFDRETYVRLAEKMRKTAEGRRILDERRTLPGIDLDALAALPEGTLGHEYARYFRSRGIEPFTFEFRLADDADFLNKRYRETHDIHHMITGYGNDDLGEVELQAFYVGNLHLLHAALIAVTWIPVQIARGAVFEIPGSVRRLRAAYRRGKRSRMLLGVSFDELWDRPVSELARELCAPA
jgi:ubiquinone biosynthesis protein COQ4